MPLLPKGRGTATFVTVEGFSISYLPVNLTVDSPFRQGV